MPIIAAIMSILAGATAADAGPLAPAAEGMVQCYEPDDLARTCRSIAGYRLITGGTYANDAAVLISPTKNVILEITSPVEVKNGAVCGTARAKDVLDGRLRAAGSLVPQDKAAPALAQLVTALAAIIDKEVCTFYTPKDGVFIARASIDGIDRPELNQRVKWIKPSEGYKVSP